MTALVNTFSRADEIACPGLTPDDCYIFDDECEYGIQSNRKRAAATSYYAKEMGVRFRDVSCTRAYLRLLTRQESYDHDGSRADNLFWDWYDNHEPVLT
jgi:hypothetical protein